MPYFYVQHLSLMPFLNELSDYVIAPETAQREYHPAQIGSVLIPFQEIATQFDAVDLFILGCGEFRGENAAWNYNEGPNAVREELYKLYYWHTEVKIADLGNIRQGNRLADTASALHYVLKELGALGKRVLVLGGSHDLTLQQYNACKANQQIIDMTVVDMLADLDDTEGERYDNHLMDALTGMPNYMRHFNLMGFQSYYVNPMLIETFHKLHFDCIRVGKARENMEELEPAIRRSHVVSIDINAIRYSDAPANQLGSPNGFYGDEMCKITRFAGMGSNLLSLGIYGYRIEADTERITAKLLAQMVWYFIDGILLAKAEAPLSDQEQFLEYTVTIPENRAVFLKSRKTNRWWMQLPDSNFIPCTYNDYITACSNQIPERWLREVERTV
ncbi:MAG: arginase [Chitinophagaceae bacterium]|nr:arginase [Chitinophagaceae bacterium]